MKFKSASPSFLTFTSCFTALMLTACLGGGIDPTEDPVQPAGNAAPAGEQNEALENNAGLNDNNANLNTNNGATSNTVSNNTGNANLGANNGGGDGEAINNAADENFLGANNNQANMFGNNPGGNLNNNKGNTNNLTGNNVGLAPEDPADGALINGAIDNTGLAADINKGATDNTALEPLPPEGNVLAPVENNPTVPPQTAASGAVVRYVIQGGSKLYDKPNGRDLKALEQGDHPLVNDEGEWSRTSDGYYTPSSSLSTAPIGRAKQAQEWR